MATIRRLRLHVASFVTAPAGLMGGGLICSAFMIGCGNTNPSGRAKIVNMSKTDICVSTFSEGPPECVVVRAHSSADTTYLRAYPVPVKYMDKAGKRVLAKEVIESSEIAGRSKDGQLIIIYPPPKHQ